MCATGMGAKFILWRKEVHFLLQWRAARRRHGKLPEIGQTQTETEWEIVGRIRRTVSFKLYIAEKENVFIQIK